jgi:hypothetical protein
MVNYDRLRSCELLRILGIESLADYERTRIWEVLGKRAHASDNVTGAISNNGPQER